MNIIANKQAVAYAGKWAVDEEKGPLLLEFPTHRYGGHSYPPYFFKRMANMVLWVLRRGFSVSPSSFSLSPLFLGVARLPIALSFVGVHGRVFGLSSSLVPSVSCYPCSRTNPCYPKSGIPYEST